MNTPRKKRVAIMVFEFRKDRPESATVNLQPTAIFSYHGDACMEGRTDTLLVLSIVAFCSITLQFQR